MAALYRHANVFGTLDGALAYVLPLNERVYRRLHMLQNALVSHLAHVAGLNPRSARQLRGFRGSNFTPQRNMVDGDLVWQYLTLSGSEKHELARRIGSTCEQLLDDLLEIHRVTTHF